MKRFLAVFIAMISTHSAIAENLAKNELRIFSYNIRHGKGMDGKIDLERLAKVIEKHQPDLVALQEVDKNCTRSGNRDISAELGKLLGMEVTFGKSIDLQGGEYGVAVLSRLPIVKTAHHLLPGGSERRSALEVQVKVAGLAEPLSFVSVHNDWEKEEIRVGQVQSILDAVTPRNGPIILAGDFNEESQGKSLQLLSQNAWQVLDAKGDKTYPANKPKRKIDFFVTKNFEYQVAAHEVIDEPVVSDHRPIRAVLKLKTQK